MRNRGALSPRTLRRRRELYGVALPIVVHDQTQRPVGAGQRVAGEVEGVGGEQAPAQGLRWPKDGPSLPGHAAATAAASAAAAGRRCKVGLGPVVAATARRW